MVRSKRPMGPKSRGGTQPRTGPRPSGQDISSSPPKKRSATVKESPVRPTVSDASAVSPKAGRGDLQPLADPDVTRGRVVGYTVDSNGLVVKLECSAISRIAFSVSADSPHFRPAVSMAMIALNNRVNPATQEGQGLDHQYLWVKLRKDSGDSDVRTAMAVGLSYNTDADPFDIKNFVFSLED